MNENRHRVIIKTLDEGALVKEIFCWGEAGWWPKRSLMRFERKTEGPVAVGTRYVQKVMLPFAPQWEAEVDGLRPSGISRKFLGNMFDGHEDVHCRRLPEGFCVEYAMSYEVKGFLNRILWSLVFRRLHDKNIEDILNHLKKHLESQ